MALPQKNPASGTWIYRSMYNNQDINATFDSLELSVGTVLQTNVEKKIITDKSRSNEHTGRIQ